MNLLLQELLIDQLGYPTREQRAEQEAVKRCKRPLSGDTMMPDTPVKRSCSSASGASGGRAAASEVGPVDGVPSAAARRTHNDSGGCHGCSRPDPEQSEREDSCKLMEWPSERSTHPAVFSVIAQGDGPAPWNLRASWAAGKLSARCLIIVNAPISRCCFGRAGLKCMPRFPAQVLRALGVCRIIDWAGWQL